MKLETQGELLLLGTGASAGVPVIGCHCPVCQSTNPCNKRLRASALLTVKGKAILIDAGPDLRQQALSHQIEHIDGVILTHTHYDHTGGIDELRTFNFKTKEPLLCLASDASLKDLQIRFYYLFTTKKSHESLTAKLSFQMLEGERGLTEFLGIPVSYMSFIQGGMPVNGFRFGDLAYISDIREYPQTIFEDLRGVKTLVLSALREEPSPMHFHVTEAVAFANRVGAEKCWLTHIGHELDHEKINAQLPSNIRLAYDGLKLSFSL